MPRATTGRTAAAIILLLLLAGCRELVFPAPGDTNEPAIVISRPVFSDGPISIAGPVEIAWRRGGGSPTAARWLLMDMNRMQGSDLSGFDPVAELSDHPGRYEEAWSRWTCFAPIAGLGDGATVDPAAAGGARLLFAVQARDARGRVTNAFSLETNARLFRLDDGLAPVVTIHDHRFGPLRFSGNAPVAERSLFEGTAVEFAVAATAAAYQATIRSVRWGWDLPGGVFASPPRPGADGPYAVPPRTLEAGTHTFSVEAIDIHGNITTARVEIETVPLGMERPLLWVDDFAAPDEPVRPGAMPTEAEHDGFWTRLCGRAAGFDPSRDVWDVMNERGGRPPGAAVFARYRNVVWTYSSSGDAWGDIVRFVPESRVAVNDPPHENLLPRFLEIGGHLWTLGRSERRAGLAEVFSRDDVAFPAAFTDDRLKDADDCMAWHDYCVSVVDKVWGPFRSESTLPPEFTRSIADDALAAAVVDPSDPVTGAVPGLPSRLDLADLVTAPGMYFDPAVRGFVYVEVYDPAYWMDWLFLDSRPCFHPAYRMKTRNATSVIDGETIAFWITSHADIVPPVPGGTAAPSIHCGFPLWFFDRAQADSLADAVFLEWGID